MKGMFHVKQIITAQPEMFHVKRAAQERRGSDKCL